MRVLVCGGRDYRDWRALGEKLGALQITYLITGGASGADTLADCWAIKHSIPRRVYMADWKKFGPSAGPIRNQQMLDEGKPDLVVAFPGGKGTADMVRRATDAGIKVERVE